MTIDILLPFDHFEIKNLDRICQGLNQQIHTDFNLKILCDPVHKEPAIEILKNYPNIKHELFEHKIFDIVDLDYYAIYQADKRFANLYYNEQTSLYQQFTKVISSGQMLLELLKHSQSDYISIIDAYTIFSANHLSNLYNASITNDLNLASTNAVLKGCLQHNLYHHVLDTSYNSINTVHLNNNPDNLIIHSRWFYLHTHYANLSPFLIKRDFFNGLIDEDTPTLSKFGLYWTIMLQTINNKVIHLQQFSTCINLERYRDYYAYEPKQQPKNIELQQVCHKYQPLLELINQHPPEFKEHQFQKNQFDLLNDDYYQNIVQFDQQRHSENQPLITIGITFYNKGLAIIPCLNSVINQSYKNLEIICINDCSTDNTAQVLDNFAKTDPRIKVVHLPKNGGTANARNAVFEHANGEYLQWLDGDDMLRADTMQICIDLFDKHSEIDFVRFPLLICHNQKTHHTINELLVSAPPNPPKDGIYSHQTYPHILRFWVACFGLYKLSFLRDNNLKFEHTKSEDGLFNWHVHDKNPKFYYLNQPLYYYIMQPNSTMTKAFSQHDLTGITLLDNSPDLFKNHERSRAIVHALHWEILCLTLINKFTFNKEHDLSDYELQLQIDFLNQVRDHIVPRNKKDMYNIIKYWLDLNSEYNNTFIIFTMYFQTLSNHDYQTFIKFIIDITNKKLNIGQFQDALNPKYILPADTDTPKHKRKHLKKVFKTLPKVLEKYQKYRSFKQKLKTRKTGNIYFKYIINKMKYQLYKYLFKQHIKQLLNK